MNIKLFLCAVLGHSNIVDNCFGQITCGRCGEILGDSLMGCYSNPKAVIIGHNCATCRSNYKNLSWKDKLFIENPFKGKEAL